MISKTLIAPFLRVALFQGLKPLQLTEMARNGERVMIREGQVILREGEEGDAAFLIVGGAGIQSEPAGSQQPVFHEGTLLGEMAMLIDGHHHQSTIVAPGNLRAFKLTRAALHRQMEADPELAAHFVAKISGRLALVARELRRIDLTLAPHANRSLADRLETQSVPRLTSAA